MSILVVTLIEARAYHSIIRCLAFPVPPTMGVAIGKCIFRYCGNHECVNRYRVGSLDIHIFGSKARDQKYISDMIKDKEKTIYIPLEGVANRGVHLAALES